LNFPVAGGTSGHILGATLVAIVIGPWSMMIVMTCVIGVQALLFQDGGVLALGFNVINMGIISGLVGYAAYRWITGLMRHMPRSHLIATGFGAWLGIMAAAAATALELGISGTSPLSLALPAMLGIHAVIGIGEALVTVAAVSFIRQTRPDLLIDSQSTRKSGSAWAAVGIVVVLLLVFLSPFANPNPDGLEQVAQTQGFDVQAQNPTYTILPDYTVPFIQSDILTTIAAGLIGVVVVGGLSLIAGKSTRKTPADPPHES